MFAQVSEESTKSFIEKVPDIIRAAASNPLGLVALIVLVFGILAYFLFRNTNAKIKLSALALVALCVVTLAVVAIHESGKTGDPPKGSVSGTTPSVASCKVSGSVYNEDLVPAVGLQQVKLAYVTVTPANSPPVPVATTGPDGRFSFNCSQIKPEAFPIHLRATFSAGGTQQSIESEDQLVLGENLNVNVYVSPRATANHYRVSTEILRIPSAQLFRHDFVTVTNAAATARRETNHVVAIPRSVRLPKETISRLRMNQ